MQYIKLRSSACIIRMQTGQFRRNNIQEQSNYRNTMSEHFSLAKKVRLSHMEFETERLKYFTRSLTASYDFMKNIFLNALLTANSNDIGAETGSKGKLP